MQLNKYRTVLWLSGAMIVALFVLFQNIWKVSETQNLKIYYRPFSYAEKHLAQAQTSYENSFVAAEQFLSKINKTPKVKVYLYDNLKNKGFAKVEKREVHFRYGKVFRLTSVHEFLHIFLYELNPNVPLRFEEGVCRIREGKSKKFKGQIYQILYYQLVKLTSSDRWVVEEVFQNKYKDDDEGNIAAAFALFAMQSLGEKTFWTMYQELDQKNWQQLLGKYFGKSIDAINVEFNHYVNQIPDPPEAFKYKFSPKTAYLHQ
ncbi:MAG: hypothetical protein H6753_06090 [Candidatus Omnitrophica bacterium]|nr:hypothetical protein [Candidatus Omnitrophota bacterium]